MSILMIAVSGFLAAIVSQIVALRLGAAYILSCAMSLGLGILAAVVALAYFEADPLWEGTSALLLFASWWFIFLNFIQASQSSLRVQLLHQLSAAGRMMRKQDLLTQYNDEILLQMRLHRLLECEALYQYGDRYFIRSRSLKGLAAFFRGLKICILGRPSEFSNSRSKNDTYPDRDVQ